MKRDTDIFANPNAFLVILAISALFQSIIFFAIDLQLYTLPSFFHWVLAISLVSMTASILILKYYRYKQYTWAFIFGIIALMAGVCQLVVFFMIRILQTLIIPSHLFVAATEIFYGIALIFSKAGKRTWLRAAGIGITIHGLIYLSVMIWAAISPAFINSPLMVKIFQWNLLLYAVIPAMFIMNFLREPKISKVQEVQASEKNFLQGLMALVVILAVMLPFIFGFRIAGESLRRNQVKSISVNLAQIFEARTYKNSRGDTMSYRLLKPIDYDSTKKYPLMVCLHGGAGWGTDNMKQLEGSLEAQIVSNPENRKKYPAFLFVPQCPVGTSWGGNMLLGLKPLDSLVFEIIDSLENEFEIDTTRRYVMGHSLGGYGTWHFICSRPEMFAAGVPMAGGGDAALAKNIVDVPLWAFHGRLDRNAPVTGSRHIIEAVRSAGGNPRYTEYPYEGHGIWDDVEQTPELMDWLFAQKRE